MIPSIIQIPPDFNLINVLNIDFTNMKVASHATLILTAFKEHQNGAQTEREYFIKEDPEIPYVFSQKILKPGKVNKLHAEKIKHLAFHFRLQTWLGKGKTAFNSINFCKL